MPAARSSAAPIAGLVSVIIGDRMRNMERMRCAAVTTTLNSAHTAMYPAASA